MQIRLYIKKKKRSGPMKNQTYNQEITNKKLFKFKVKTLTCLKATFSVIIKLLAAIQFYDGNNQSLTITICAITASKLELFLFITTFDSSIFDLEDFFRARNY